MSTKATTDGAGAAAGSSPGRTPSAGRWWSLAGLCLASAIVWYAAACLPVATPAIADDIGGTVTALQWANTIFTLATGALVIAAGRLGDIFGRRRVLDIGLLVFAAGSVLAALAHGTPALIGGRAVMGVAAAAILPATLAIIPIEFHGRERVTAFSVWMATAGVGQAAAPAISGALTTAFGWQAVFWVNVPLCLGVLVLVWRTTPESRDETAGRSVDVAGLATIAAGLIALMYALNEGPVRGWTSPVILGAVAAAVVLVVACVLIERRVREPLIDLALFKRRSFDGALIDNFVFNLTLAGTMYVLALYLEEVRGYEPLRAGLLLLPSTVGMLALIPLGARLELHRGPRLPIAAGTIVMGVGTVMVGILVKETPYWWLAVGMLVQGLGIGLLSTPLGDTAVGLSPPRESGAASGAFKMSSMVGGAFGVAVLGAIYQGFQLGRLKAEAAAAVLSAEDRARVQQAFQGSAQAKAVYQSLAADVRAAVHEVVTDALALGIGNALKVAAAFTVLALVAVMLLVPKGVIHQDGEAGQDGGS